MSIIIVNLIHYYYYYYFIILVAKLSLHLVQSGPTDTSDRRKNHGLFERVLTTYVCTRQ